METTQTSEPQATKPTVFVLMPFADDFKVHYDKGIRPACRIAKADCKRVDDEIHTENILSVIYKNIRTADVIVADMTGRNPNVYFESGYAMALEKRIVFLTQQEKDIPFDLKQYYHVIYGGDTAKLRSELSERLTKLFCVKQFRHPLSIYSVIDQSEAPMYFAGMDGVIQYCNKELGFLADIDRGKILGKTIDEFFHNHLAPRIPHGFGLGYREYVVPHQEGLLARVRDEKRPHMDEFFYLDNEEFDERNTFHGFQMVLIHADRISVDGKVLGWFVVYLTKRIDPPL